jgi:hypothetical protein
VRLFVIICPANVLSKTSVWRVARAFETKRYAILLVAGDKSGGREKRFCRQLIAKADKRFVDHLARLEMGKKN